jgi:ABC-2 type transport system permease protein
VSRGAGIAALMGPQWRTARNRWRRSSRAERSTLTFFGVLGLVFWVFLFGLFGVLVQEAYAVEVFGPILTRRLLEMLLIGLFALLCFSNTVSAISSFYLSADLELVLSLPLRRETFFYARFTETLIQSSWMMGFFGLPVFTAYGLAYGAGWAYPLALIAVLPGFVLIPTGLGVTVASLLVRSIPADRVREGMVLVGLVALAAVFVLLRLLRPERLMDAEGFDSLAAYVAELQVPVPRLLPPRWAVDVLEAALRGTPFPWIELGLLLTGGIAMAGLSRAITSQIYDEGRARATAARSARLARAGWLDLALGLLTRPLPPVARAVVVKDVKSFVRDASQWSQVFLVGAIVVIAMVSATALPTDFMRGPYGVYMRESLAFGALALVGFIMASVATRFQFTAVSLEARAFWIVRTAPLTAEQLLWAKLWPSLLPMVVIGEVLAIGIPAILGAGPFVIGLGAFTALVLAFGISGLAVGIGAAYPDFKADNAAKVAASPAAMLFMVAALVLVFAVVGLEILPIGLSMVLRFNDRAATPLEWAGLTLPLVGVVGLCAAATVLPLKRGAKALWARELPNS